MKKFVVTACFVISMCGWFSCTKDTAAPPPAAPVCDSTKIGFNEYILPIFKTSCILSGCHDGNSAGVANLNLYITAKTEVSDSTDNNSILCRLQGTTCGDQMPLYGRPLNAAYIDTIKLWKAEGYCE